MLLRTILIAALVAAPLAIHPASASAQERGQARAAAVQAQTTAGADNCPSNMPAGLVQLMQQGGELPPGLQRCFAQAEPEPVEEPAPEEECELTPHPFLPGFGIDSCTGEVKPLG